MERSELQRWTDACLALVRQEQLTKTAAVNRIGQELAFQRSGISGMELYVSVTLACQARLLAAPETGPSGTNDQTGCATGAIR